MLVYAEPDDVPSLAEAARAIDGIQAVAEVGNGLGWLESWQPSGEAAGTPRPGFMIPIEILSVDPATYREFVPSSSREAFGVLEGGEALLGRSAAVLRDFRSTGTLDFGDSPLQVAGVVDDELVASHELVVSHRTATSLGIDNRKYVLLALGRRLSPEEVLAELTTQFPNIEIGSRVPGESEYFRPGGETLPQVKVKEFAGEFAARPTGGGALEIDPEWIVANTANEPLPLLGRARCHRRVLPQIRSAFQQIIEQGLQNAVAEDDFGGCFAPRLLGPDPHSGISRHAWGIAFDFNVSNNLYGRPPSMDPRLIEVLEDWGFTWGGRWRVPDGMHFEYLQPAGATEN